MKPMTTTNAPLAAATILDVAKLAGVSRTTVSRAMNEPDSVSESLLERVRQAAAELNYVPSTAARSLRSGRTGTIALLVGDISQPFHGVLAKAVARAAGNRGMNLVLGDLDHSDERLQEFLQRLPKQGIDGVIVATADSVSSEATHAAIRDSEVQGVPVVLTMPEPSLPTVAALSMDYIEVGRVATARVLSGGHSVVLMVGQQNATLSRLLVAGYTEAVAEAERRSGVALSGRVVDGAHNYDESVRIVSQLLDSAEPPDGLVVASMPMALGAIRAIEERGLTIPHDVAIVVCEDVPLAAQMRPAVTSVGVNPEENGEHVVRLLVSSIRGESSPAQEPLRVHTIERETSRAEAPESSTQERSGS